LIDSLVFLKGMALLVCHDQKVLLDTISLSIRKIQRFSTRLEPTWALEQLRNIITINKALLIIVILCQIVRVYLD
jgi:hypothetical protein